MNPIAAVLAFVLLVGIDLAALRWGADSRVRGACWSWW